MNHIVLDLARTQLPTNQSIIIVVFFFGVEQSIIIVIIQEHHILNMKWNNISFYSGIAQRHCVCGKWFNQKGQSS